MAHNDANIENGRIDVFDPLENGLSGLERLIILERTVKVLAKEYEDMRGQIEENTKITKEIKTNTEELISIFNNAKGANKALLAFAKWIAILGGGISAIYALWHILKDSILSVFAG